MAYHFSIKAIQAQLTANAYARYLTEATRVLEARSRSEDNGCLAGAMSTLAVHADPDIIDLAAGIKKKG